MTPEPDPVLVEQMFHRLVTTVESLDGQPIIDAIGLANEVIAEGPAARDAMIRAIEQWMALGWAQGVPN